MTDDLTFRRATAADLPAIVALLADDALGQNREIVSDPIDPAYLQAFTKIDADPNQFLLVVDEDGSGIVGTLQLTFIDHLTRRGTRRAQIEGVRIAAGHRGRGLGEKMFLWALAKARDRGCSLMQLTTDRQRPDAHEFYKKLGFAPTHIGFKLTLDD